MKIIDKFLKKLNTNRNTFATFILTLISFYICIDRIMEMLIMIFTGTSISYWGPFRYTLALACPTFAFLFSGKSSFASSNKKKVTLFYAYMIALYIVSLSMFTQWFNMTGWLLFMTVPNFSGIVSEFQELIRPAFMSLSLYLPLVTLFPFIKWIVLGVNDSSDMIKSIWDYGGIDLSDTISKHNQYECNIILFKDEESGKTVTFYEKMRFQPLLVCGGSGSGKTALIFEPFIAKDLEKKLFFSEISKEMGYTALKTGLARLNRPYDNEYLNKHFSLTMLKPELGKEGLFKSYMKNMMVSSSSYKDMGLTYIAPDIETISHIEEICKNFNLSYNIVDPCNLESIGMNPFVYDDVTKIANTITSVLKETYTSNFTEQAEDLASSSEELVLTAIQNLCILLKEVYPMLNEGALPNLEDMLKIISNFDLAEKMCKVIENDPELSDKYAVMLSYFKRHFYKTGHERNSTESSLSFIATQLDSLLRTKGAKQIICNRYNNINFDNLLSDGNITLVCTQRGELGGIGHKAFGLFFLTALQNSVLSRPGTENTRIPHFLYIDEFPEFICRSTDTMFTMYRKYKVACTVAVQHITQLSTHNSNVDLKELILANCSNKIFTGNGTPEETELFQKFFGERREWKTPRTMNLDTLEYEAKSSVKYDWDEYFKSGKLQKMPLKKCAYLIRQDGNKPEVGCGLLDFLGSKYREEKKLKKYDFNKYSSSPVASGYDYESNTLSKDRKFNPKNINFEDDINEINPIQTVDDNLFDNEDAIVFNLKRPTE